MYSFNSLSYMFMGKNLVIFVRRILKEVFNFTTKYFTESYLCIINKNSKYIYVINSQINYFVFDHHIIIKNLAHIGN